MADIEKITFVIGEVGALVAGIATAIEAQALITRNVVDNVAQAAAMILGEALRQTQLFPAQPVARS